MNMENMMAVFQNDGNAGREVLDFFLRMPLSGTDEVFAPFAELPGAVEGVGKRAFQRFIYVPGSREDRVLLVAHADTVWDSRYGNAPLANKEPGFAMGIYFSKSREHGIGADGRAGCALLWALRESGHSLLLLDGEESGRNGVRYLMDSHAKLFREINKTHRYAIALDAPGNNLCAFDQPDSSHEFKQYVMNELGVQDANCTSGSDICLLCKKISGVNLGVGYFYQHSKDEVLFASYWSSTCQRLDEHLRHEQPKFLISRKKRIKRKLKRALRLPLRAVRRLRNSGLKGAFASVLRRMKK